MLSFVFLENLTVVIVIIAHQNASGIDLKNDSGSLCSAK
jgi:hypothetical protein